MTSVRGLLTQPATCRLLPEQTAGPYHRGVHPARHDITEGRPGVPLRLGLRLTDGDGRTPLQDAVVDVWQADASGRYSGFLPMPHRPDGAPSLAADDVPTDEVAPQESYLRGSQRTDGGGVCWFATIWPGWYSGRTVHVHVTAGLPDGRTVTTQLYFPDELNDEVLSTPPYDERGRRDTTNTTDSSYADGGAASTLRLVRDDDGWTGMLCLAVAQGAGRQEGER